MCGIVGDAGQRGAVDFLIEGLRRLEYRGYDSAGVATLNDGELTVTKSAGRVDGRIPIGTFSGDHLEADMSARTVTLNGRASLRIEQNGLKGRN